MHNYNQNDSCNNKLDEVLRCVNFLQKKGVSTSNPTSTSLQIQANRKIGYSDDRDDKCKIEVQNKLILKKDQCQLYGEENNQSFENQNMRRYLLNHLRDNISESSSDNLFGNSNQSQTYDAYQQKNSLNIRGIQIVLQVKENNRCDCKQLRCNSNKCGCVKQRISCTQSCGCPRSCCMNTGVQQKLGHKKIHPNDGEGSQSSSLGSLAASGVFSKGLSVKFENPNFQ